LGDADLIWASDATGVATMNGGLALGGAAAGTANITAAARVGNVVSPATVLTVTPPPPFVTIDAGAAQLPFSGAIDAGGFNRYRVVNLGVNADQLVFLTATGTGAVFADVFTDNSFATLAPFTTDSQSVTRGAVSSGSAGGEIFIQVSGTPSDTFTLDVKPLPVVQAGVGTSGSVAGNFAYFKVIGLTPAAPFTGTLTGISADLDLFIFDNPIGVVDPLNTSPFLCAGNNTVSTPDPCLGGTVPASGVV
jgi:hypothetical protein